MQLDTATTLFYYVLTSVTLAVLLVTAFRGRLTPPVRLWLASLTCHALGWILIVLAQAYHYAPLPYLGPLLLTANNGLMVHALMAFYGSRPKGWWTYWALPLVAACSLLWSGDPSRYQIALNAIFAVQIAAGAVYLLGRKDPHSGLRLLISASVLAAALMLAARAVFYLFAGMAEVPDLLWDSPLQTLTFGSGFILRLVFTCGFLLLIEAHRHDELVRLAAQDSLTGIYNRRTFMTQAEVELDRSRRHRLPLALLLIDLDYFKAVNDTYGHQAGDHVLKQLCRRAETCLRGHDLMGRYGGEEFCVLAPETDLAGAVSLAERLRNELAAQPVALVGGKDVRITLSVGIAYLDGGESAGLDELLSRADAALYRAKNEGRNRVKLG